ncbi:PfkB family carbohydrate kinase [Georgenia subflava]|uniref:Carbohydrate kinase PfkB domain-containing protein n=1 Tax=Georgenia subflava TaxID=1622177 RepID=A0A6N7EIX5_9MICO|nr:PfkB family carbohydrate kinase [Georgenia subflava]MPV38030.1 hypothetical protein [Georgenia subflava]
MTTGHERGTGKGLKDRDGVVVIGDALVDIVEDDDATESWHPGGAGLNVAIGIARQGMRAQLAYPAAPDDPGRWLRETLDAEAVEVIALPSGPESGTARSRRIDGEPNYAFSAAVHDRQYTYPPDAVAQLRTARALAVSSFPLGDADQVEALINVAHVCDLPLAVDPNVRPTLLGDRDRYRANVLRLAEVATLVKASRQDIELLFPSPDDAVPQLRSAGTAAVVVTDGEDGATVHTTKGSLHVPAASLNSPVVDTMGAGDAVFARLLVELVTENAGQDLSDWHRALTDAMALARATCQVTGPLLPRSPAPATPLASRTKEISRWN